MSQVSRKKTKIKVKKEFYWLMNKSNFGYDCKNNIDNCNFKDIFNDINEIAYIEKYSSHFG